MRFSSELKAAFLIAFNLLWSYQNLPIWPTHVYHMQIMKNLCTECYDGCKAPTVQACTEPRNHTYGTEC